MQIDQQVKTQVRRERGGSPRSTEDRPCDDVIHVSSCGVQPGMGGRAFDRSRVRSSYRVQEF